MANGEELVLAGDITCYEKKELSKEMILLC